MMAFRSQGKLYCVELRFIPSGKGHSGVESGHWVEARENCKVWSLKLRVRL
jgi:hypothetical protein